MSDNETGGKTESLKKLLASKGLDNLSDREILGRIGLHANQIMQHIIDLQLALQAATLSKRDDVRKYAEEVLKNNDKNFVIAGYHFAGLAKGASGLIDNISSEKKGEDASNKQN